MNTPKLPEEIDPNLQIVTINGKNLTYWDITKSPFAISGFAWFEQEHTFCRLPQAILPETNEGVQCLAWHTAGGLVRFKTDSRTIGLKAKLLSADSMPHMPNSGLSGFDLYVGVGKNKRFCGKAVAPCGSAEVNELMLQDTDGGMREYTLNFPLYNGVESVCLALDPEASVETPTAYEVDKPVLFYGSSITQGGCASRPGNAYTNHLCRWLDAPMINLGFSGSARGETIMAETIASLDLGAFVLDYDHNAPTVEHLEKTHEAFFKTFRAKSPATPVVFMSKPDCDGNLKNSELRHQIIRQTYENAKTAGDRLVTFVDGATLFGNTNRDACTVDGCHPNDLGFMRMAETIYPVLAQALLPTSQSC